MKNFLKNSKENLNSEKNDNLAPIIDHIISEAGLDILPEAELQSIKETLGFQINRRLGLIIIDNLNDDALNDYHRLLDGQTIPDPEKLEPFLAKNIPNYQEKVKEGLDKFIKEAIASLKS